jgi:predicted negative regulator of RcsB-dependent stress response
MNTENLPEEIPAGKPAAQQQLEQHEVSEVLDFFKQNGIAIVVGVALAVVGFLGFNMWKSSKQTALDTASSLLANAQSAPQFQEIINNYPDTPAAPLAYLSLAASYYDQGQFEMARQTYATFQTTYPAHDMLPIADLGLAQSLEALGSSSEALAAYDDYIARHEGHYMAVSAIFGKARTLEAMKRFDEAIKVYEDFITANPESRWTTRAETGLDFVTMQQRAASAAPAVQPQP